MAGKKVVTHTVTIVPTPTGWHVSCPCGKLGEDTFDRAVAEQAAESHLPGSVPGYTAQLTGSVLTESHRIRSQPTPELPLSDKHFDSTGIIK